MGLILLFYFRAIRKRTLQREEYLNKQKEKSSEQIEFDKRVAENKATDDSKTAKKRLKRQRMKANKKKPKVEKEDHSDSDCDVIEQSDCREQDFGLLEPKIEDDENSVHKVKKLPNELDQANVGQSGISSDSLQQDSDYSSDKCKAD